ncbi:polysaccharide pyruvyl transferase CsaB [Carboxydocella thermautotrophica]|nr:polysaccharide pyruvyl transferase CsaB [Carboxydocella thermautotrophica]
MRSYKIVLSGYYGFNNLGDEALLGAISQGLNDRWPQLELVVLSHRPETTAGQHQVRAVNRWSLPAVIKELKNADLLISGGGSLFQDVTGNKSLYYYLAIVELAHWLGVPTLIYGQGFGPVLRPYNRRLVAAVLNRVDYITVRDSESAQDLRQLGIKRPPLEVVVDPVLGHQPTETERAAGLQLLTSLGWQSGQPTLGLSLRPWLGLEHDWPALVTLARYWLGQGGQIVLLPMQYPGDWQVLERLRQELAGSGPVWLPPSYSLDQAIGIYAWLDLVCGMRLHALIFGALWHKPLLGISYDPKVERFIADVGQVMLGSSGHLQAEPLIENLQMVWQKRDTFGTALKERLPLLSNLARRPAQLAFQILSNGEFS